MKRLIVAVIMLWTSGGLLLAQEDVKKMMDEMEKQTQEQIVETEQQVQDFIEKDDLEFAKFLKQEWEMMQAIMGKPLFEEPKPVVIPKAEPKEEVDLGGKEAEVAEAPAEPEATAEIVEETEAPPVTLKRAKALKLNFYSQRLKVGYDEDFETRLDGRAINNQKISKFWETLSATDYKNFVRQTLYLQDKMKLNDWGYTQLIYNIGKMIYKDSRNESNLFTWFMLIKSGYNVKVAYSKDTVYLLLPTENILYSTPYLTIKNQRFYLVSLENQRQKIGKIYSYKEDYPGATRLINLEVPQPPVFRMERLFRTFEFSYEGTKYTIPVEFNGDVVVFFENYPQTDFEIYYNSNISDRTRYSLVTVLKPLVTGKSEAEAANVILRFVQTAFNYKTDDENFGREKPLFPEETLFYEYSDCEDRSILYAHLVRDLLGLPVIGLTYPGHMATAVLFSTELSGDKVPYEGKNWIVCDPTYINADVGDCIPRYQDVMPKIVKIGT
jgi:hypothetical protein